jgi:hypothetical protein
LRRDLLQAILDGVTNDILALADRLADIARRFSAEM